MPQHHFDKHGDYVGSTLNDDEVADAAIGCMHLFGLLFTGFAYLIVLGIVAVAVIFPPALLAIAVTELLGDWRPVAAILHRENGEILILIFSYIVLVPFIAAGISKLSKSKS
ncbi:MAG: hypothetical protein KBG20_08180 [Caldilineaceae bacterium]|nr:hypothetical protein [Caldilineaceae bacterium]MBP8106893.1 hypothetical protein [Caldilineaceae bacterium]MBP8125001.1 hypothetical protein [Caldilineaceae bacterium]MBP9072261.1 hypothetical protein [Caldilineaceae bacterium]